MLTYTAATEEGNLNVISLIKNHHLSRKVKGHRAWKPAAAACCQCIWPKAEQTDGDTAAPAALLHPRLHLLTASNPEQGLTISVLLNTNSLSYKAAATGIRHRYPFLYLNLSYGFTWQFMQKGCIKGKGMQATDRGNLAQIQPLQTCRKHQALGFSGQHTPASRASLLPTWASACPSALTSSSCKEKEASCQEAAGQEIPRAVLLSPNISLSQEM